MIIFAKIIKSIIYKDFILLNVHPANFGILKSRQTLQNGGEIARFCPDFPLPQL